MSDTNINAFIAEVQEAEKAVATANGNLIQARKRLEDKKLELGIVEEPSDEVETDGELEQSPDQGVVGDVDPIPSGDAPAIDAPVAGDVIEPTEPAIEEDTTDADDGGTDEQKQDEADSVTDNSQDSSNES